ncbi:MAG: isopeptide-forming domain-containing fimbrial protein [Candidatus Dojkabacteria bacterium]
MRRLVYITIGSLIALISFALFSSTASAFQPGNAQMRVRAEIDGLATPDTALEGMVISVFTPLGKDMLAKEQNYNGRGAAPALYFVTNTNGRAHMDDGGGGDRCGTLTAEHLEATWGMQIYGVTFRAMQFGGTPSLDRTSCTETTNTTYNIVALGYLGQVQCITAAYNQARPHATVSRTADDTLEYYRFVPYFPQGWFNDFGSGARFTFDADDPKGGGYFKIDSTNITSDNQNTVVVFDQNDVTFETMASRFPNSPQTTYVGRNNHQEGNQFSESLYLNRVGNLANVSMNWTWVPEAVISPTPTPTPSPTPAVCGMPCDPAGGPNACEQDHQCIDDDSDGMGVCQFDMCIGDPSLCESDMCTPLVSPTPTPSPTPTFVITACGEPCDPAQGADACEQDHTCTDDDSDGTGVCQLNMCIDTPSECLADMCTPIDAVTVVKTASQSCGSGNSTSVATYSITVTNPDSQTRTFNVTDTLDSGVSDNQVILTSITFGGMLSNGVITWSDIDIDGNSSVTLNYDVEFTQSQYNQTFENTVIVTEGGTERGRDTATITPFCTPDTALISDVDDRIIFAIILLAIGATIFRFGLHVDLGEKLWDVGGKYVLIRERKRVKKQQFEERSMGNLDPEA